MSNSLDLEVYASQGQRVNQLSETHWTRIFEQQSLWYRTFFKGLLPQNKAAKIFDIPCGNGNLLYFLRKEGYTNIRGLDIDAGRVDAAQKLKLAAEVADALTIIKTEKDVDVIFSLDFLEHLEKDMAIEYIRDCSKALKPGGLFIARMPVTDSLMGTYDLYNDFTHKWSAHAGVIAHIIGLSGFSDVQIKDERPVLYKPLNYIRLVVFKILSTLHNLYLSLLGFPKLTIWSRSAYFIARK